MDLVRAAYQLALERSDPQRTARSIDCFLEFLSDSVVFVPEGGAGLYRGRAALKRLLEGATQQWNSVRYEVDEIQQLGTCDVLVFGKVLAQPDEGREPSEIPFANRWTLQKGRAVRIESLVNVEGLDSPPAPDG